MNKTKIETNLMNKKNLNLQTQESVVVENEIEIKKLQLKKLMNQRKKWRSHNQITLSWFFYVNDNENIDNKFHQLVKCFFCYP
jgi:hypothetical protein